MAMKTCCIFLLLPPPRFFPAANAGRLKRRPVQPFHRAGRFFKFCPQFAKTTARQVLLSPEINSQIPWNQLIVSWNADAPASTLVKLEASASSAGTQTKFYNLAQWSPDGTVFPRTSSRPERYQRHGGHGHLDFEPSSNRRANAHHPRGHQRGHAQTKISWPGLCQHPGADSGASAKSRGVGQNRCHAGTVAARVSGSGRLVQPRLARPWSCRAGRRFCTARK